MKSQTLAVDVVLQLGNAAMSDAIERAFSFYIATYLDKSDPASSFAINYQGIQSGTRYRLTFLTTNTPVREFAESVHRFMEAFLDEFYDETVEEDWLCELNCEELPMIIDYDVETVRCCHKDN